MLVHRLVDLLGKMDHFEATCPENLKGGTIDLESRADKFLIYLAGWRYFGMSVGWLGCLDKVMSMLCIACSSVENLTEHKTVITSSGYGIMYRFLVTLLLGGMSVGRRVGLVV